MMDTLLHKTGLRQLIIRQRNINIKDKSNSIFTHLENISIPVWLILMLTLQ